MLVALVDEQPLLALVLLEGADRLGAGTPARPDDREPALHLLAVDAELQLAVVDRLLRIERGRLRLPRPPVPDDDVARPVLLRRDDPFEIEVFDGVVLDVDGHAPRLAVEAGALRDGPADEHALDLEAEVVVQPGRAVALDDEPPGRAGRSAGAGSGVLPKSRLRRYSSRGMWGVCQPRPGSAARWDRRAYRRISLGWPGPCRAGRAATGPRPRAAGCRARSGTPRGRRRRARTGRPGRP